MRGSGLTKLEFTESNMGFHAADSGTGGGVVCGYGSFLLPKQVSEYMCLAPFTHLSSFLCLFFPPLFSISLLSFHLGCPHISFLFSHIFLYLFLINSPNSICTVFYFNPLDLLSFSVTSYGYPH